MLSKIFSENIKELFNKKKYQDIILKIEEFSTMKNRPNGLSNLIGVCKIAKLEHKKNAVISTLLDFKDIYNKSKKNLLGVEALTNFITTCVTYIKKYHEFANHFPGVKKMYEVKEKFLFIMRNYLLQVQIYSN